MIQKVQSLAIAVALTCLLAACGGGGDKDKTTSDTAAPLAQSDTATRARYTWPPLLRSPQRPSDLQYAAVITLSTQDLPNGWTATAPAGSTSPRSSVEDEVFVQCLFGENPSKLTAYLAGSVYTSPDQQTVIKSFSRVVESRTAGARDFSAFTAQRVADCQTAMYDYEQHPPDDVTSILGKKFGTAPPNKMPVDAVVSPDGSKEVRAFRMIVAPTDYAPLHQDIMAYGAGRYESVIIVQSSGVPDTQVESIATGFVKNRTLVAAAAG